MSQIKKTLGELATIVDAKIKGDKDSIINGVSDLQTAQTGQISFLHTSGILSKPKYKKYLETTLASAIILNETNVEFCRTNALIVKDPYYAFAKIAEVFAEYPKYTKGIHPTAIIGKNCKIDETASIGEYVVIGDQTEIGKNTRIDAGCIIGERCKIGNNCHLWANVTIYYNITIGNSVVIHSGTIIGSDGFGWANHQGKWQKIPQLGSVIIGDNVDVGANTCIDRGALKDTIIENGVILDNLIQIAHNVKIGENTAIAGCTAVAGSAEIGKHCMIGGKSTISPDVKIADRVILTGTTVINNSIKEPGMYSSGVPYMKTDKWKKNAIRFRHLDELAKKVQSLLESLKNK